MLVLEHYDDLDYARDKTKTIADYHDVPLTWKNKSVTLDLSADNYDRLSLLLDEAVKVGKSQAGSKPGRTPAGRKSVAHGGRRSKAYYEGLVAWADANDITKRDGSGRPAYQGHLPGRNDYPDWLIRDYDAYLAASGRAA